MEKLSAPTRIATTMLCLIATGALAACGSTSSSTQSTAAGNTLAAACRATTAADQTVTTRTHVFLLHSGSEEKMVMLSPAEAKTKHITSGELMLGGSMAPGMSSGMSGGHMATRHLEVHICERAGGKVVTGAMPMITVTPSAGGSPQQVPVAVMEGVGAGSGDLHYGNNVPLHSGTSYTVTVGLAGDRAAFRYAVPRGM